MNDHVEKERFLGSEEESLGWKVYGWVPLLFCGLAIFLFFSAVSSKASEEAFLQSSTTLPVTGQVDEILAENTRVGNFRTTLGKPDVRRIKGAIVTGITRSGRYLDENHGKGIEDLRFISVVSFTALDGQSYSFNGASRLGRPAHVPGDSVQILYDSENPSRAKLSSQVKAGSTLGFLFGLILLALAALLYYFNRKRKAKKRKLFEDGIIVEALISDVTVDKKIKGNDDEHPIRIVAQWVDAEQKQSCQFTSAPVFKDYDPSLINETVKVVMVPDEPDTYHVDTTFLDWRRAA